MWRRPGTRWGRLPATSRSPARTSSPACGQEVLAKFFPGWHAWCRRDERVPSRNSLRVHTDQPRSRSVRFRPCGARLVVAGAVVGLGARLRGLGHSRRGDRPHRPATGGRDRHGPGHTDVGRATGPGTTGSPRAPPCLSQVLSAAGRSTGRPPVRASARWRSPDGHGTAGSRTTSWPWPPPASRGSRSPDGSSSSTWTSCSWSAGRPGESTHSAASMPRLPADLRARVVATMAERGAALQRP